jgi:hypothetical protein
VCYDAEAVLCMRRLFPQNFFFFFPDADQRQHAENRPLNKTVYLAKSCRDVQLVNLYSVFCCPIVNKVTRTL